MTVSFYNHRDYSVGAARELLKETDARAQELHQAMRVLPRVDRRGNSDCPIAPQIFAQAERARKGLGWCLGHLVEYSAAADTEIHRCRLTRNKIIESDRELYGQHAKGYYKDSVQALDKEIAAHTETLNQLRQKISNVQGMLGATTSAILPGERPSRYTGLPSSPSTKTAPSQGQQQPGPMPQGKMNDLFQMDLRRTGGRTGPGLVPQTPKAAR